MAGFCLAGISAAAIRGKKSPLKLGQQLQLRGAEVICLPVPPEPAPAGHQQKCPGWGRRGDGASPSPLYAGESRRRGRDLVTGVSFPWGRETSLAA